MVVGDLFMTNLPISILGGEILDNIGAVTELRGTLYILGNQYLTSMFAFQNLQSAYGIHYSNNPFLLDARMPGLQNLRDGTFLEGCDRLCPAYRTKIGYAPDDPSCVTKTLIYVFHVTGLVLPSDTSLFSDVFAYGVSLATGGKVCLWNVFSLCLIRF